MTTESDQTRRIREKRQEHRRIMETKGVTGHMLLAGPILDELQRLSQRVDELENPSPEVEQL